MLLSVDDLFNPLLKIMPIDKLSIRKDALIKDAIIRDESIASLMSISDASNASSTTTSSDSESPIGNGTDLSSPGTFEFDDIDIIEEHKVDGRQEQHCISLRRGNSLSRDETTTQPKKNLFDDINMNFQQWKQQFTKRKNERINNRRESIKQQQDTNEEGEKPQTILQNIIDDFTPNKGDQKILRAIGRTATVNAAVLLTAATGGAAGAVGYVAGGAITTKRLAEGIIKEDEKEITKSLAVYGCATGASIAGQAITGALMIGVAGASLPLALPIAFGVGCVSGISAGALSEFTVDSLHDKVRKKEESQKECIKSTFETMNSSSTESAIEKRTWTAEEADLIARLVCKFL